MDVDTHRRTMVHAKTLQIIWHSKEPVYSGGWAAGTLACARLPATAPTRLPPNRRPRLRPLTAVLCVPAVDFHPNGQLLTAGADKEVKVWEVGAPAAGAGGGRQRWP